MLYTEAQHHLHGWQPARGLEGLGQCPLEERWQNQSVWSELGQGNQNFTKRTAFLHRGSLDMGVREVSKPPWWKIDVFQPLHVH